MLHTEDGVESGKSWECVVLGLSVGISRIGGGGLGLMWDNMLKCGETLQAWTQEQ